MTNHGFKDPITPIMYQPNILAPVTIGDNVWIGTQIVILAGVTIADGTVIAAGAVVTKLISEPNMTIGDVPAKTIKPRFAAD